MGTWDINPWDNDSAADWFGDLMDSCAIRAEWLKGIHTEDDPEVTRAAMALFVMLGRVYIWPINNYDDDLELAISKGKKLLNSDLKESDEIIQSLQLEIEELESRRKKTEGTPATISRKPWWKFW